MLKTTTRPLHTIFTHFLMEKDQLTAHMARFGAGFILDNQLKIAREHLDSIKVLLDEVEARKSEPRGQVPIEYLGGGCGGGSCYRK